MKNQELDSSTVFIPIDYEVLKDKKIKLGGLIYIAINSQYDDIVDQRRFDKTDLNYSHLTEYLALNNTRAAVKNSIKYLVESEVCKYIRSNKKSRYIEYDNFFDKETKGKGYFYLSLPVRVWEILLENMSELTLRVFFYLYREWSYWQNCRGGTVFTFSITQLCKGVGYNPTSKNNREKVEKSLTFLKASGIIDYDMKKKVPKGKGYYIPLYSVTLDTLEKISSEEEMINSEEIENEEDIPKVTVEIPKDMNNSAKYLEGQDWLDPITGTPF